MTTSLELPLDHKIAAHSPPRHLTPVSSKLARPKSWPIRLWYALCSVLEWLFGLASLLGCLAAVAAVPVLNFIVLGYLLEASGSVAKSGRIRDGFIDIGKFARIGSLVAGTWLCLLLPRLVSSLATDAWLIDPGGAAAAGWRAAQIACTVLVIAHILLAWYSGGRLRHFFWPLLAPFQLASRLLCVSFPRSAWERTSGRSASFSSWFPPAILLAGIRRG